MSLILDKNNLEPITDAGLILLQLLFIAIFTFVPGVSVGMLIRWMPCGQLDRDDSFLQHIFIWCVCVSEVHLSGGFSLNMFGMIIKKTALFYCHVWNIIYGKCFWVILKLVLYLNKWSQFFKSLKMYRNKSSGLIDRVIL